MFTIKSGHVHIRRLPKKVPFHRCCNERADELAKTHTPDLCLEHELPEDLEQVTCSEPTVTPINSAISSRLFPRSTSELMFYIVLALTAGICEEFIFRGFVIAALFRAGLSTWAVVFFSSLMFGVAHLYQGKGGSAGTGILGILFAMARITYHSLLPVVAWHAALDVVAGIAGARFFVPALADRGPGAEGDGRHPNENGS